MKNQSNSVLPAKLAQGRQQFEHWRTQQKTRRRLPDHLWSLAVELAREYGVSKTAPILRLDYNVLKKKSQSDNTDYCGQNPTLPFLELRPASNPVHAPVECSIDMERSMGDRIRIQLKGPNWPDLTRLCERLWDTHA